MSDPINPKHYKHLPVEAIDIIEAAIAKAPSNEAAYLQGQVLKYLLRCWSKKGIEDLRKAKWYLDRLVNSFDEVLAEASEASSDPIKPSRTQPPSGYRLLGDAKDEPRIEGDSYWSLAARNWELLISELMTYANRENWTACRKIEPPKRYREPTPADLSNGAIECEVRDSKPNSPWHSRILLEILSGSDCLYRVQRPDNRYDISRWPQCRIEVAE